MSFYGLSDEHVLKMPISRFWLMSRSVDRISAERDMRAARVAASVQSGEGVEKLFDDLHKEMGEVARFERRVNKVVAAEQLDREGLHALKGLGRMM